MVANAKIAFEVVFDSEKNLEAIEEKLGGVGEVASKTAREAAGLTTNFQGMEKALLKGLGPIESWSEGFRELNPELTKAVENAQNMGKQTEEASGFFQNAGKDLEQFAKGLLGVATVYAGGRWLIGMARDSLEVARAAGVAEDTFDDWEESTAELQLSFGSLLARALEPFIKILIVAEDAVTTFITANERITAAVDQQVASTISGTGSYEEYVAEMIRVGKQAGRLTGTLETLEIRYVLLTEESISQANALLILSEAQFEAARASGEFETVLESTGEFLATYTTAANVATIHSVALSDAYGDLADQENLLLEDTEDLTESTEDLTDGLKDAAREANNFFDAINRNIGNSISGALADIRFMAAGGGDLLEVVEDIGVAVGNFSISMAQGEQLLEEAFIQATLLEIELGNISQFEAATLIAKELNVPLAEARQILLDAEGGMSRLLSSLGILDGSSFSFTVTELRQIIQQVTIQSGFGPPSSGPQPSAGPGQGPSGGIGSGPDPDFSGLTEVVPEGGDAPMFVDSVPITIVTNDPLKAADEVIVTLGKL